MLHGSGSIRQLGRSSTQSDRQAARQEYLSSGNAPRSRGPARGQNQAIPLSAELEGQPDDFSWGVDIDLDGPVEPSRQYSRESRSNRDQVETREKNWNLALKKLAAAQCYHRSTVANFISARNAAETANVKAAIAAYIERPLHLCRNGTGEHRGAAATGSRSILYYSANTSSSFDIPIFSCPGCGSFEMPATACHCFPSTPVQPSYWIDLSLLSHYSQLYAHSGVSSSAFCQSLADLQQQLRLLAGEDLLGPELESDLFSSAWVKYLEMTSRVAASSQIADPGQPEQREDAYSPGLAGDCPGCAELPDSSLSVADRAAILDNCSLRLDTANLEAGARQEGTSMHSTLPNTADQRAQTLEENTALEAQHRPFCVVLDGNQKMSHYQKCGATLDAVHQSLSISSEDSKPPFRYFGHLEDALPGCVCSSRPSFRIELISENNVLFKLCTVEIIYHIRSLVYSRHNEIALI